MPHAPVGRAREPLQPCRRVSAPSTSGRVPLGAGERLGLLAVLALAAALRVAHLFDQPNYPWFFRPRVDAWFYHETAQALARGDWLLDGQVLHTSPGYFYLLGALYRLAGPGPWAPRILQLALGVVLVGLVWDTARRAFGARIAWLPALAAAAYGPLIWFEGHLLSDSLGAFTHMLLLWLVVRVLTGAGASAWSFAWLGLGWGLTCVVRSNALLLGLPVAYAWFTAAGGRRAISLTALALGAALVIAPVTLRNWIATGEPVLLTPHAGVTLYVGNAPGATGTWRRLPEIPDSEGPHELYSAFHAAAERALARPLTLREANAYWTRHTLELVAADLPRFLRVLARKFHLYWNGRELHNIYDYEFARVLSPVLGLPLVQFLHVAPFALVGALWLLFRSRVERGIALYVLTTMTAIVLVFVTDRYRLPVVGPALIAATGLVRVAQESFAARARGRLAALAVLLALACTLALPVRVNKRFERKYYGLGHAWLALGRLDRAQWALERSLDAQQSYLPSHEDLAHVFARAGDTQRAQAQLERWEQHARRQRNAAALERAAELRRTLEAP